LLRSSQSLLWTALSGTARRRISTGNLSFVAEVHPDHRLHPAPRVGGVEPFIGRPLRDVWSHFAAELRHGVALRHPDVTPTMTDVMLLIDRDGTRISDLARRAGVTKQSMAQATISLEDKGLVHRLPDPRDARAKLVVLTDDGWEALRFGRSVADGIHQRWTSLLSDDAMAQLVTLLGQLADALDAASRRPAVDGASAR
jgi:DNA-binding MarR family transcriptional regulator